MARIHLMPFDPSKEFVAQRAFLCRNHEYARGDIFDKKSVPHRTLRILYEGRSIGYPEEYRPVIPVRDRRTDRRGALMITANKALVAELVSLGVAVDRRWNKARLVDELMRFQNASDR